mmetsp:Transcript_6368/g.25940  ORF Transcript_6368/g.25940 Transcript_6368/m.25940 type:complete len:254 (+) Transcript_6368:1113-1874(+)
MECVNGLAVWRGEGEVHAMPRACRGNGRLLDAELVPLPGPSIAHGLALPTGAQVLKDAHIAQCRQGGVIERSRPLDMGDAERQVMKHVHGATALERLAQIRRRDLHRLAVFGHRAARALDALLLQHRRQRAVGQRLLAVLGGDELLDQRPHRGAGGLAAGFGTQARAEEVLQLEGAPGRGHVLGRRHARDGGLVQAELVGDLAQHQRLHRQLAVREEAALAFDDRGTDAQDGVEALLDVLDEPARLLQLAAER